MVCAGNMLIERLDGTSCAIDAQALDPGTHLEERPGELDYCHYNLTEIWKGQRDYWSSASVSTPLCAKDVDLDGVEEVLFGTDDGRVTVIDPMARDVLLDMAIAEGAVIVIEVGNVDEDPGMELVCIASSDQCTLVCVDFSTRTVQWSAPRRVTPEQLSLFDDDADGVSDILVTGGSRYWRIDGHGDEAYNGSLDLFNASLGPLSAHLIDDLDADGALEALFVDKYYQWGAEPECRRIGRKLWMIDLGTGRLELARGFPELVFYSDPMLLRHGERAEVLVGLGCSRSGGNDLWAYDLSSGKHTLHDLSNGSLGEDMWTQLSMAPGPGGPIVLMNSASNARLAWSAAAGRVIWCTAADSRAAYLSHTVVCDLDGDGEHELVSPFGKFTVLDAMTGALEVDLGVAGKMAFGDLDGDGLAEMCVNLERYSHGMYYDNVSVIDSPPYIEWEAGSTDGTVTLYADVEGGMELMVKRMTKAQTPPSMSMVVSNPEWGDFLSIALDIRNGTMVAPHDGRLRVGCFEGEPTESALFIRLRMRPGWGFSWGGPNALRMLFDDRRGRPHECRVAEAFIVERDLVLVGPLGMRMNGAPLAAGSWVMPDVEVAVSGFDVVFEGTLDLRPARSAFTIIEQLDGTRVEHTYQAADRLAVVFMVPRHNGPLLVSLGVNQTLAGIVGRHFLSTTLRVDGWWPLVIEPEGLDRWHGELPVEVTVCIDEPDSGMDEGGVRYAVTKLRTDEVTRWYGPYAGEFGATNDPSQGRGTHWAKLRLYAPEGLAYLRIETTDRVGNRGLYWTVVRVDRTPPAIRADPLPGWQTTDRIELRAEVTDVDGCGVDPRTVLVSCSNEDPPVFRNWRPMTVEGEGERVTASVLYSGVEGRSNHFAFKAWDLMGHEAITGPSTVWIDSTAPEVRIESPVDGEVLEPPFAALLFRVSIFEDGSGLGDVVPSLTEMPSDNGVPTDCNLDKGACGQYTLSVRWYRTGSARYGFSVRCTDAVGNLDVAGPVTVRLHDPPCVRICNPHDGAVLIEGHECIFKVEVQDDGAVPVHLPCEWTLDGRPWVTGSEWFSNSTIPSGTYNVTVAVSDGIFSVRDSITITVVEPARPPGPDGEAPARFEPPRAVNAAAVVALLSMLVIILLIRRRRQR